MIRKLGKTRGCIGPPLKLKYPDRTIGPLYYIKAFDMKGM